MHRAKSIVISPNRIKYWIVKSNFGQNKRTFSEKNPNSNSKYIFLPIKDKLLYYIILIICIPLNMSIFMTDYMDQVDMICYSVTQSVFSHICHTLSFSLTLGQQADLSPGLASSLDIQTLTLKICNIAKLSQVQA